MIAHHQHWLLAFTALLSRNGPDRRARQCERIGDTHRRPLELLDVREHADRGWWCQSARSAARRPVEGRRVKLQPVVGAVKPQADTCSG